MSTLAKVKLWGRTIGAVFVDEGQETATFEYDRAFVHSGIEIAPLTMPLADRIYSFPELSRKSFNGLPGLLSDSLPDRFGNALIDAWLATQGRLPESFNAVERLCYIGSRGMGALEYEPVIGPRARKARQIQIDQLVELASEILSDRSKLSESFETPKREQVLKEILKIGTSAGGARAKAVIAWNPITNEVRSGQIATDPGFEHWLIKFDGVQGNKDKELEDPKGYGAIEYAYYRMATSAGIAMNECRLFEEGDRRHFMTRRFDRLPNGEKLHMQSLGAMAHYDFNMAGAYGYEQALLTIKRLGLPMGAVEEQFRRMVFNIVARNQDDHVKNIAFLLNKAGRWSLAPAFDMTYSFNPAGQWTATHQMTVNTKRDGFTLADLDACAKSASMKRGRAKTIAAEVIAAVSNWKQFAAEAGVPTYWQDQILSTLRLNLLG
jgi:serine/threonine-protein kinase HipA